jgi:CHAT domain-containing protein
LEQATLLRESKQPSVALQALTAACEVFSEHQHHIRLAQAQLMTAECYRDLGKNERARSLYRAVLDLPARRRLPTLAYRAHYGLGQVEEAHNHPGIAHRHYRAAIRQIEIIRGGIQVDEFKASFLDDKLAAYQAAVRLSLARDNLGEAFEIVERAKSSALLDLLARSLELKAEEGKTTDSQVWEQLRQLKETWAWHYSRLEKPSADDGENGLRGRISDDQNWEALHQVEAQFNQTLRQIQGHRLASLTRETNISWEATADLLVKDDLLIEYFCLDDKLVAFLIDAQGLRVVQEFPYSLREIRRSASVLNLALKRLRGLEPTYIQEVLGPLAQRHLSWLFQALVAPLKIEGKRKLIILPDDVLHYLPFHAFHDGKRYLIERFELQYAPSASVLARCHTAKTRLPNHVTQYPALILGYSNSGQLQHVSNETKTVAATLKSSRLFQETDATLAHLRQYGMDSRLIHIASHAVFRADNPLFSSIQLADEPLNVIDLYHLNLRAQLVTLSACETGINQLKGGDLFGLVRGCLYAGAPSVVVSLWQVDDASTAELMQNFYQQLKEGEPLGSALRRAQLQFLQAENKATHHPHYWAPFCLIGADGNIA